MVVFFNSVPADYASFTLVDLQGIRQPVRQAQDDDRPEIGKKGSGILAHLFMVGGLQVSHAAMVLPGEPIQVAGKSRGWFSGGDPAYSKAKAGCPGFDLIF